MDYDHLSYLIPELMKKKMAIHDLRCATETVRAIVEALDSYSEVFEFGYDGIYGWFVLVQEPWEHSKRYILYLERESI